MTAQKAEVYEMSSQFIILYFDVDSNSFYIPRLPFVAPPAANQVPATTTVASTMPKNNERSIPDEPVLQCTPPLQHLLPLPSTQPVPFLCQPQGAPLPCRQPCLFGPHLRGGSQPPHQPPLALIWRTRLRHAGTSP